MFTINCLLPTRVLAIVDPGQDTNNKFGVHILSAVPEEASAAADLVNSKGGNWGYITVPIEKTDRNLQKWQQFFDYLRVKHLIPLLRLATQAEADHWQVPTDSDASDWANFLNQLNWPVKNRYVIVYNEPNQGQEWDGSVDPAAYAKVLDQTINALKAKSSDFFILNAGLDASAPNKTPNYADELDFLQGMDQAVPGIFNKLDGWDSHSYPNPGFVGSPQATGRGTVDTWEWELDSLKQLGLSKNLPVFITETGWRHAEGLNYNRFLPSAKQVGDYFSYAFTHVWNDSRVIAVTPFLLNYQTAPFDHFSFKRPDAPTNPQVLGAQFPNFYDNYIALTELPKLSGRPVQIESGQIIKAQVFASIAVNQTYTIPITFKNSGQSIWNQTQPLRLSVKEGKELGLVDQEAPKSATISPGQTITFNLQLQAKQTGKQNIDLSLVNSTKEIEGTEGKYSIEVKDPVVLEIKSNLKWKKDPAGEYLLKISSSIGDTFKKIVLDQSGQSSEVPAPDILPDYNFSFTLQKPFYKTKVVNETVHPGINVLDFGTLDPDILGALFNPPQLWKLLPWSK